MKKGLFFLCFSFISCFATVCVPLSLDLKQGFRQDHLKIKAFLVEEDLQKQTYKEVRFWQNTLTLRTIQRDIYLLLSGGYAFFGSGKALFVPEDLSFTSTSTPFSLKTKGEAYDVKGVFGYSVNLTPERYYKVVLTPLVGYQALWEKLKRKDPAPNPFVGSLESGSFTRSLQASSKNLWTKWMGPFVGGEIWMMPGGPFAMKVNYAFHFLQLKQSTFQKENVFQFDTSGVLTSAETITFSSHTKKNGGNGHFGSLEFTYLFSPFWNFSIEGNVFYFSSHVQGVGIKKEQRSLVPLGPTISQIYQSRYKSSELSFSGLFTISRSF